MRSARRLCGAGGRHPRASCISQIREDRIDKIKDRLIEAENIIDRVIKVDKTQRREGYGWHYGMFGAAKGLSQHSKRDLPVVSYRAFVEIEEGVEGLIHVSELSRTKRITRDVLTVGQELEAVVLVVNRDEQKISLGVRQLEPNPWDEIAHRLPDGQTGQGNRAQA